MEGILQRFITENPQMKNDIEGHSYTSANELDIYLKNGITIKLELNTLKNRLEIFDLETPD